jgi:peroxiredoxin Q/BCP
VVVGVSRDSVASHQKFKAKYELPFALLSDPDGKVCEKYGVIKEKNMYGRKVSGIDRSTFIIDETGKIVHIYNGVKVQGHIRGLLDTFTA